MSTLQPAQKLLHLEFLRIVAIILVIYNHAGTFVIPNGSSYELTNWLIYFGSTTCKVAVPLFFMISGALLLGRQEDYVTLYKKRVWRFIVILVVFIVIQHLWKAVLQHISDSNYNVTLHTFMSDVAYGIMEGNGKRAQVTWFLYAYLMLLVFLPLLRALAAKMRPMDYMYLLSICCVCEFLLKLPYFLQFSKIYFLFKHTPFMPLSEFGPFTAGYGAFYMLMGFFAERHLIEKMQSSTFRWSLAGISVLLLILSTVVLTIVQNQQLMGCFLPIPTIAIYLWAKYMFERYPAPSWYAKILCLLGSSVFVVMLTENIWRTIVSNTILPQAKAADAAYYLYLTQVLLAFALAATLGMLLKLIPVIKRYI